MEEHTTHTFLHFVTLPRLEIGHRCRIDDLRKRRRLEVLFSGLFVGIVFTRVLLETLQSILLLPVRVHKGVEELFRLFSHVQHIRRGHPERTRLGQQTLLRRARRQDRPPLTRASRRFASSGYTRLYRGTEVIPGTVRRRCIPATTYRWTTCTECRG